MAYIKLAYAREIDGKQHKAGAVVETDYSTASNLIHQGLAQKATKPRKAEKPEANLQTTETNRKEQE
jgi:hypothetical protein